MLTASGKEEALLFIAGQGQTRAPGQREDTQFSSVQFSSLWLFATPRTAACQASLSITNTWSLLKLMSIELVMSSNHLILCCPLFSCLQSFPASQSSNESALRIRWPEYWSFSFSISPFSQYSGLISFRTDLFDLLAVREALNITIQKHQFFGAQPPLWSNSYICSWLLEIA